MISKKKVLINASNLHVGGGVQVAASFISELSILLNEGLYEGVDIHLLCSESVKNNLPDDFDKTCFSGFDLVSVFGPQILSRTIKDKFSGFDVCFSVFGPIYFKPDVSRHICGFAQPWIAYPDNLAYRKLGYFNRLKNKLKFGLQNLIFKSYEQLVVEQEHIKSALVKRDYPENNIAVVSNCVSSVFERKNLWDDIKFNNSSLSSTVTLGFIGRPYLHKNISILKEVNDILINNFDTKVNFLFTFTDDEMQELSFNDISNFHTVGSILSSQCPSFYDKIDALVFPSLLECFSAAPIEAMKMEVDVIASDFDFVREVCKDAAFYFDPTSVEDIAQTIFFYIQNQEAREIKKQLAKEIIRNIPTARDRAVSYMDLILK
ncbi:glycosyltransferase [Vibrio mediterranei]|uniref:glycosyltransferase n=1 Tax=Vibrio mediterranei TaxID=689 RepID=UPI00406898A5